MIKSPSHANSISITTLFLGLVLLFSLSTVSAADGSTLYVNGGTGSDLNNGTEWIYAKQTIQNALDSAPDNSVVNVASGTYTENIKITKNVILVGAGSSTTNIDGDNKDSCIQISPGVTVEISGFNFVRGNAHSGGGINNQGTLTLKDSVVIGNRGQLGGGICNYGSASVLTLKNTHVTLNYAYYGSGIANHKGTMFLDDSIIDDNEKARFQGTQIFTSGTVYANNTVIGGKIYYSDGTTRESSNYPTLDDVYGPINNQRGGVDPTESEDTNPTILEAASSEKISSNPSTNQDLTGVKNQELIGMQETGTPVNYIILAILMIISIFCLKTAHKGVNWN
ncbi:pectinesterase family protein [Methanobacterium formicicum]|uniref:Polymorphic membrane protein n=1 Tax=Methanobacterium formicicum (strain DSM 3637 / PP1) TaxID=1204725 RepID=K2R5N4_METFP|nr:pectinesterase family protein [Methanobacterium formicicum]EKF86542.1 polymorphic membrane protein [Methanobacterium formicicum DSM 3637]